MRILSNLPQFYMAPIRGITDPIFRCTFHKHFGGFDFYMAPFIKTNQNGVKPATLNSLRPEQNLGISIIPQIIGKSSADFLQLAKQICELGYTEINWNLGCPHPVVTKKKMGSGLLPHPDDIDRFLNDVCSKKAFDLSIKTRLGLDQNSQLQNLMPVFNQYPIKEITIHGRIGTQHYEGNIHKDAVEQAINSTHHTIVYNGDITTAAQFQTLQERFTTIDKWMIGRGVLYNLFLARQLKTLATSTDADNAKKTKPTSAQKHSTQSKIRDFHQALFNTYAEKLNGPAQLLTKMKTLWQYLATPSNLSKKQFKQIQKAKTVQVYLAAVEQLSKA